MLRPLVLLAAVLAVSASAQTGAAQPSPIDPTAGAPVTRLGQSEQTRQNTSGYYYYHLPGEATIQVQVEGSVLYPGLYEVSDETGLRRLLALAGGPKYDTRDRQNDRRVEIRLLRPNVGVAYAATLADAASNPAVIPPLRHDDTILVDVIEKRRFGWQDAATVIGTIGTLAFILQVVGSN